MERQHSGKVRTSQRWEQGRRAVGPRAIKAACGTVGGSYQGQQTAVPGEDSEAASKEVREPSEEVRKTILSRLP